MASSWFDHRTAQRAATIWSSAPMDFTRKCVPRFSPMHRLPDIPVRAPGARWFLATRRHRPSAFTWGRLTKVGVNPISSDQMYVFCLDNRAANERIPEEQWKDLLTGLLMEFSGPMARVRERIKDSSLVVYRPLESLLLPPPWHRGAIVLVGDAAHATTPHLASGAALGMEDAIVLVEELDRASTIEAAASAYTRRRFERCRMVVENSLRLGEIEMAGVQSPEHAQIMRDSLIALLAPI